MTSPIGDLLPLGKHQQPPEIEIIKAFIQKEYQTEVQITVQPKHIFIGIKSAALAGTLRMRLHELQELCQTDKRLVLRIGG